ncbi:MAG: hypothetical protein D6741_12315 [Planctomycetota bacterium]|nr:MAG: hypothetical protein D6741_12315 [Planctomycetota bacterium]
MPDILGHGLVQAGFAGFSFALLIVVVWLVWKITAVVDNNTKALTSVMDAVNEYRSELGELKQSVDSLRDELVRRPCLGSKQ